MRNFLLTVALLVPLAVVGQKNKKADQEAIKSMCGCFDVTFNFSETFSPNKDYEYHDKYRAGGLEYAFAVEDEPGKIVIQHLLIVGDGYIVKHWRQDWEYQNTDFYVYDKDKTWKYKELPKAEVKGEWSQKVFQVDDGLRYEGSGIWVHHNGEHYWENTADAPLPRREFSKRDDYNVMVRGNRHVITETGWLHEQDNQKVLRTSDGDELLAWEKGWNTYDQTDLKRCQPAIDWWEKNKAFWADVRWAWDQIYASKVDLSFVGKVDDKPLHEPLFALGEAWSEKTYDSEKARAEIMATIRQYLKTDLKLVSLK